MKKIVYLSILAVLICLLLTCSVSAGFFPDVTDEETAKNVEQLRLMGIIDGMGHGNFDPEGMLTRAQFCKMAVVALGEEGNVGQYKSYTIYPDVRQTHWAIGYINLAVRSDNKFITGFPDGTFRPNDEITYGQAITILMRLLGYKDEDVGMVWPDGYIAAAKQNGLTDGISLKGSDKITRAQAAKLFANLLITNKKSGSKFISGIAGAIYDDVIVLSNNAVAADGTEDALLTSAGIFKMSKKAASSELIGEKGMLVLDAKGKALTFIPDNDTVKVSVVVSSAKQNYITDDTGALKQIKEDVKTFVNGAEMQWSTAYTSVLRGTSVTLYYGVSGAVEYVFIGGGYDKKLVIVSADGSLDEIETLTDNKNFVLFRNGAPAKASDLCKYDVAVYDSVNNRVDVSNHRITAIYEDASPSFSAPEKVTVLGMEFEVLPTAADSFYGFNNGQSVTVLLTEDNKVAGAVDPSVLKGNAKGLVKSISSNYAEVELTFGLTVTGDPDLGRNVQKYAGGLVNVSSDKAGYLSLDLISLNKRNYGDWDIEKGTLGFNEVLNSVAVYEYVDGSELRKVDISELPKTVPTDKVVYIETEKDKVYLIVLNDVTGNSYAYGRAIYNADATMYNNNIEYSGPAVSVVTSETTLGPAFCIETYKDGEWIAMAVKYNRSNGLSEAIVTRLTDAGTAPFSAVRTNSVIISGETYSVPENVQCYNENSQKWLTLENAMKYADHAEFYAFRGVIRVIVIN